MNAIDRDGGTDTTGSGDVEVVSPLLGRKSVLLGMAASMGVVLANAAQPSASAAGTVKPSPIAATTPDYIPRWKTSTAYSLGQQVVSPNNDVTSAKVAHVSSTAYTTDTAKWNLSSTYLTYLDANGDGFARLPGANRNSLTGWFHLDGYGAVGNGTTDDSAALTACLAAARSAKGTVYLSAGKTYILAGGFDLTGVTLSGYNAIVKVKAGVTLSGGLFSGTAFTMQGLTIDLNKGSTTNPASTTSGMAIYAYGTSGWTTPVLISDVTVKSGYQVGISLATGSAATNPVNSPSSPAIIENTVVSGCQWGIMTFRNSDVTIRGCTISGMSQEGIYDFLSQRSTIIGNTISGCGSHGVVTAYGRDTRIVGNSSSGNPGGSGLCVGGGDVRFSPSSHWTISDNTCIGNGGSVWAGITVDPTVTGALQTPVPSYGTISGNVCMGNQSGIVLTMAKYTSVTGNTCSDNHAYGITAHSANDTITGNTCAGGTYGICLFGAVGDHQISGNNVEGNSSGRYTIDATVPRSPITYSDTHTPWVGTWGVGSRVVNSVPAVGSPKAWVCIVAGSVGTWISEGNL